MPHHCKHTSGLDFLVGLFAVFLKLKGLACEDLLEGVGDEDDATESQQGAHLEYVD